MPSSDSADRETLGRDVVPSHYTIRIAPDWEKPVFSGRVDIEVDVKRPLNSILINVKALEVVSASVLSRGVLQKAKAKQFPTEERVELSFKHKISGKVRIGLEFTGIINSNMHGLYKSKYVHKGKEGHILSTHFEPSEARAMFPCFDEPAFKATYDISATVDKGLDAISNMPEKTRTQIGHGKALVQFGTTPRMSSYLVYLGVGNFEQLSGRQGKLLLRVLSTPGGKRLSGMALEYAKRIIDFQQRYFGIKFPLPKLDLIAVPDFAMGAMENWGAVTFRESEILVDKKKISEASKQRLSEIISHEFAHQWFGDLVTMEWWDDLWLNESFAVTIESKTTEELFPKWHTAERFFYGAQHCTTDALAADVFSTTHPISVNVRSPAEINQIFDSISYAKGSAVLNMLYDYVGASTFRKGLHNYLSKHSYGNASKTDLWNAIQQAARSDRKHMPVSQIMQEWVTRLGYPEITVTRDGHDQFVLEQRRCMLDAAAVKNSKPWQIPIHYASTPGEGRALMKGRRMSIKASGGWLKLNFGQAGLYRVYYDESIEKELGALIRTGKLSGVDACGIENDMFFQMRSGRIELSRYTGFVERYMMDVHFPAAASISTHLAWILNVGYGQAFCEDVKRLSLRFHMKLLGTLGWDSVKGEDVMRPVLRSIAIASLGMLSDNRTVEKAYRIYTAFEKHGTPIDPNIKTAIFITVAYQKGDAKMFDSMLKRYKMEPIPFDRLKAVSSIGLMRPANMVKKALSTSLDENLVKLQDAFYIAARISMNPEARKTLLDWMLENWSEIAKRYPASTNLLGHYVSILSYNSSSEVAAELRRFFKKNYREDIANDIGQTLELIDANIRFLKINSKDARHHR
jgi:tricorn protease interacting factor F2/3